MQNNTTFTSPWALSPIPYGREISHGLHMHTVCSSYCLVPNVIKKKAQISFNWLTASNTRAAVVDVLSNSFWSASYKIMISRMVDHILNSRKRIGTNNSFTSSPLDGPRDKGLYLVFRILYFRKEQWVGSEVVAHKIDNVWHCLDQELLFALIHNMDAYSQGVGLLGEITIPYKI